VKTINITERVIAYDMPIKGNALRMAKQLVKFWLAGRQHIRLELWYGREPSIVLSDLPKGERADD
jgi:hypothetical protein